MTKNEEAAKLADALDEFDDRMLGIVAGWTSDDGLPLQRAAEALRKQATALSAAREQGRREGMEEAGELCHDAALKWSQNPSVRGKAASFAADTCAVAIASRIRALATTGKDGGE